jgi:O-antigen ligase
MTKNKQEKLPGSFKVLFLFFLVYLPFHLALNPTAAIALASSRVIIIFLFLWWLVWGLANKNLEVPLKAQTLFLYAFLFITLFSLSQAEIPSWGFRKWLVFCSILPLYFPAYQLFQEKKFLKKSLRVLFKTGVLASLFALAQFLVQFVVELEAFFKFWSQNVTPYFLGTSVAETVAENPSWFVNIGGDTTLRAIGSFPDPHMFSFFLGMSLPLGALYWDDESTKRQKFLVGVGILIITIGLLLSFSRGGYLGIIAAVFFGLIWIAKKKGEKTKKIILGSVLVVFLLVFLIGPIRARFLSTFNLQGGSVRGRIEIWREALAVFSQHPFLGVGLGNYAYQIDPAASYRFPIYAHNTYLDIAAETGIVGLLSWTFLLEAAIWGSTKSYFKSKRLKMETVGIGLATSLIYFSIHSFFETPLFSPRILPFLVILIAATAALEN